MPDKWTESLAKVDKVFNSAQIARLEAEVDFLLAVVGSLDHGLAQKCCDAIENKHGRDLAVLTRWYNG